MKKILFGFAFVAAVGGAFAGNRLLTTSQSYKLASGPDQSCHAVTTPNVPCDGGSAICTIAFSGRALATYYEDAACGTPLMKNP